MTSDLDGTDWRFVEVAGAQVPADVTATLRFGNGRASGEAGCNTHGASFSMTGDGSVRFRQAMSTRMACLEPEGAMQVGHGVFEALRNAARIERNGDGLGLSMHPAGRWRRCACKHRHEVPVQYVTVTTMVSA